MVVSPGEVNHPIFRVHSSPRGKTECYVYLRFVIATRCSAYKLSRRLLVDYSQELASLFRKFDRFKKNSVIALGATASHGESLTNKATNTKVTLVSVCIAITRLYRTATSPLHGGIYELRDKIKDL